MDTLNYIYQRILNKFKTLYLKIKPFPRIIKSVSKGELILSHISAFNYGNAGDIMLPVVLRDLFNQRIGVNKWKDIHVSKIVSENILSKINSTDAMVIGGGGLFLKDTNPNDLSGWQWSCSVSQLKKINVPIIMFAVGYNRFRGQDEFSPIFKVHLNEFIKKAAFIGIRNSGSIRKISGYLDNEELKKKLIFQPCMTTIISKIYPSFHDYEQKEDFIAINCAFDREKLRSNTDETLKSIARVVKKLSDQTEIRYYSHMETDKKILKYFDDLNIGYKLVEFNSPKQMIKEYSRPRLVIGMRGHAQMIPFGCKTPILSIISHDKMAWFLEDISHPEWGVDVLDKNFEDKLLKYSSKYYNQYRKCISDISVQQDKLWDITLVNMNTIKNI